MRAGLVEEIVRGDRATWMIIAALWLITAGLVLAQRSTLGSGSTRVIALASLATATSIVGIAISSAVSLPRIRWSAASEPELVAPSGETWRKLRGPAVEVMVGGVPEVAVPSIDAEGRWVLFGLLSGRPIPGVAPAPAVPPELGGPRLCGTDSDKCRAWPAAWPDPVRSPVFGEFQWAKDSAAGALAHDVESGFYLRDVEGLAETGKAIELVGRVTNDAAREGSSSLFVVRRISDGRLDAMRVVSTPGPAESSFRLERASVSLTAAPRAFRWFARPVLALTSLALPLAILAYLLAPSWLGVRLRRRSAVRRELARSLVLVPVAGASVGEAMGLAMVSDDAELGDALLARGSVVSLGPGAAMADGRPVTSRAWFEVPAEPAESEDPAGGARKVGLLVPADAGPFRKAARAWVCPYAHAIAIFVTGLAAAAPAVVAVAALLGAR